MQSNQDAKDTFENQGKKNMGAFDNTNWGFSPTVVLF